jgi:hypothetical protein
MKKQMVKTPIRIADALVGSLNNPAKIGTAVKARMDRSESYLPEPDSIYQVELTILKTIRGEKAIEQIKMQRITDKLPEKGFEYILVNCILGYYQRGKGTGTMKYNIVTEQFAAVSANGEKIYDTPNVINQPQPQLIGYSLKPNETRNGWILLEIPKNENKPLLIFKRENVNTLVFGLFNYMWFQIA